jgi:RNA polymerase sigma-70 factor (ECF subfamily)
MDRTDFDSAAFVAHDAFVRSLSRSLLFDRSAAEDVAQETWLATLRAAAPPRGIRAFLAGTARNLAWKSLRGDGRRRARESRAARSEAVAPTASKAESDEIRAQVVAAVEALAEPYRSAVRLRHFEDLSPAEAARRLGVGVETFRTRLKRAYVQLRKSLDGAGADRGKWASSLLPLAGFPDAASAAAFAKAAGASGMTAIGWKAAACAVVLAAAAQWAELPAWFGGAPAPAEGEAATVTVARTMAEVAPTTEAAASAPAPMRREPFVDRSAAESRATADEAIVLEPKDAEGRTLRLSGACALVDGAIVTATRREGGGFALPARPGRPAEVFAAAEGGALARRAVTLEGASLALEFAAATSVRGKVIPAAGALPAGTTLIGKLTGAYAAAEGWPAEVVAELKLKAGVQASVRAAVAADGAFRIDGLAPGVVAALRTSEALAVVATEGAEWDSLRREARATAVPREQVGEIVLRVRKPALLRGRIVDGNGAAVPKAGVALSLGETDGTSRGLSKRTDAAGRFEFALPPTVKTVRLSYGKTNGAMREIKPEGPFDDDRDLGDLSLGDAPSPWTAEVRDDAGLPLAGARVVVRPAGAVGRESSVEGVRTDAAGRAAVAAVAGDVLRVSAEGFADAEFPVNGDASAPIVCVLGRESSIAVRTRAPAGDDVSRWRVRLAAAANAEGEFATLVRFDAEGVAVAESVPPGRTLEATLYDAVGGARARTTIAAPAGKRAELELLPDAPGVRLRVRVVGPDGRPVPGVMVSSAERTTASPPTLKLSDADGVVDCGTVVGPVRLVTKGKAFTAAPAEFAPRGDDPTPYAVAPPRTVLLRGRDASGADRALHAVLPADDEPALSGGLLNAEAAEAGTFRLTGLPAAPTAWSVYWDDPATGKRKRSRVVVPATGSEIAVNF